MKRAGNNHSHITGHFSHLAAIKSVKKQKTPPKTATAAALVFTMSIMVVI